MKGIFAACIVSFAALIIFILPDWSQASLLVESQLWSHSTAQVLDIQCDSIPQSVSKFAARSWLVLSVVNPLTGKSTTEYFIEHPKEIFPISSSIANIRQYKSKYYPVGRVLKIRFCPEQPSRSFLPDLHSKNVASVGIGILIIFISLMYIVFSVFWKSKNVIKTN